MFWTCLLFQKYNFFAFRKDALRLGSNIFETFRFTPRKISRWKNLSVFQRLMFLYQLVNLVLETCFIFSKTLKLSKTFLSWVSHFVRSFDQRALWFPYSDYFLEQKMFKRVLILECLGSFTKSIVVSISDFWHISFQKDVWLVDL